MDDVTQPNVNMSGKDSVPSTSCWPLYSWTYVSSQLPPQGQVLHRVFQVPCRWNLIVSCFRPLSLPVRGISRTIRAHSGIWRSKHTVEQPWPMSLAASRQMFPPDLPRQMTLGCISEGFPKPPGIKWPGGHWVAALGCRLVLESRPPISCPCPCLPCSAIPCSDKLLVTKLHLRFCFGGHQAKRGTI